MEMRLASRILFFPVVFVALSLEAQPWLGPYGGVYAGYASLKPEFSEPVFDPAVVNPSVDGFAGGALLGVRGARFGVEGEIGICDLAATAHPDSDDGFTEFQAEWVSRARLTLQHSAGSTLFFVAAGATAMSLYVDDAYVDPLSPEPLVHDPSLSTLTGWTMGAGIERRMGDRIATRLEAIYDRYGGKDLAANPGEGRVDPSAMTLRAAVLIRF
jgi:opacity protein-like surface antigen